ncbi:hypothetical protein N7508_005316 [Penicillium antarcticum]|uniref:uncharacterized protein n=1 Tax=Penicillium antarcticum TaxID=416450 RepID=UPI00238AD23F|nr:uncharacterized protein N7508_005316 [Penicillium antarcticum]KAJ5306301.1 hypothetical protein N7508_005316 [Penicillium antarcticum]
MADNVYRGSCLCGGISFQVHGSPEKVFMCYCQDCVKNSGAPYQVNAQLHVETSLNATEGNFVITKTTSGAEKHKRFCTRCGCTLWTIPMTHSGEAVILRAALLDQGLEKLRPEAEFFASSKPSWVKSLDNVKAFDTMPGR